MTTLKTARLQRLFHPRSGRCLDVAIDHGFFGEASFLAGIENLPSAVATVAKARPDAIQLTVGTARHLQAVAHPVDTKPALVLRTDVANAYGRDLPARVFSEVIEEPVLQGVRLDAACVVVNLFSVPGQPELFHDAMRNVLRLKAACDHYAMPLMVEPLVFRPNAEAGGYTVDGDPEKIVPLVRQAVELGADIIKADPTSDPSDYHRVIETAGGVPVLVRGGGRVEDRELLERTHALLEQGAHGIVYGRNIIQHPNPAGITRALMAMLHEQADPAAAAELISA